MDQLQTITIGDSRNGKKLEISLDRVEVDKPNSQKEDQQVCFIGKEKNLSLPKEIQRITPEISACGKLEDLDYYLNDALAGIPREQIKGDKPKKPIPGLKSESKKDKYVLVFPVKPNLEVYIDPKKHEEGKNKIILR